MSNTNSLTSLIVRNVIAPLANTALASVGKHLPGTSLNLRGNRPLSLLRMDQSKVISSASLEIGHPLPYVVRYPDLDTIPLVTECVDISVTRWLA